MKTIALDKEFERQLDRNFAIRQLAKKLIKSGCTPKQAYEKAKQRVS